MVEIKRITDFLVEKYPFIILGNFNKDKCIYDARLLRPEEDLDKDVMYIYSGRPHENGAGCILLVPPKTSVPGFLNICASRDFNAEEVLSDIRERLKLESLLQLQSGRLYGMLYKSNSMQKIADYFAGHIGRYTAIVDSSYNLAAVSRPDNFINKTQEGIPDFGVEERQGLLILDEKEIISLRKLDIERKIYSSARAFFSTTNDHPDTNWIFCAIRIRNIVSGYVAICLKKGEVATEYQLRMAEALSDVIAIEMQKDAFFISSTGSQYEVFLTELLEGKIKDMTIARGRLALLSHHIGRFFCIIVLKGPLLENSRVFNSRQMPYLRRHYENCLSVAYKDEIVLLINQDQPVILNEKSISPLNDFAKRNNLKAGISQPFTDLMKISLYYAQAVNTMRLLELRKKGENIFFSTEALPDYLFSQCEERGLQIGIHHHLMQLRDYDEEFNSDLFDSLKNYIECGRSMSEAAQKMNVHRSTLFYRLKKIEEMLSISIEDSELMLLYELSFRIIDYLGRR